MRPPSDICLAFSTLPLPVQLLDASEAVAGTVSPLSLTHPPVPLSLQVLGTFEGVAQTVRQTLVDSLVQILSPKRRIDILRDVMASKQAGRPYVVAFCGVNGVGKSTNLAKVRHRVY